MDMQSFRIDLTDVNACGVYLVESADIDHVDAMATHDGFNVHRIDLQDCRDLASLTQRMAAGFQLPASYETDWPALVAYLQRMDAIPSRGHIVLLRHDHDLRQASAKTLDDLLDTLEDTAAIWAGEGVSFFVFAEQAPKAA